MAYAERLMRQASRHCRMAIYRAETNDRRFVDSGDPAKRKLPIVATVRVRGDGWKSTSAAPRPGSRPADQHAIRRHGRCRGLADRAFGLLDTAICGDIPVNHGLLRPIRITAPLGLAGQPRFPAPTIARFCPATSSPIQ